MQLSFGRSELLDTPCDAVLQRDRRQQQLRHEEGLSTIKKLFADPAFVEELRKTVDRAKAHPNSNAEVQQ